MRTVYLDSFWIDKYEVSSGQYQKCVENEACTEPHISESYYESNNYYGDSRYDDYPVVNVDWNQAKAFCEWAGGDLPTEAQWEKAARGEDGKIYPWGNHGPDHNYAKYDNDWRNTTVTVGSYEKGNSSYGAMDMAGNVAEWVNDWYGSYDANDIINPKGNNNGDTKVRRGSRLYTIAWYMRSSYRRDSDPSYWYYDLGFCWSPRRRRLIGRRGAGRKIMETGNENKVTGNRNLVRTSLEFVRQLFWSIKRSWPDSHHSLHIKSAIEPRPYG